MYEELIKELNPKPIFNLRWYKDEDLYSEGEIEDIIINLIAQNEPEDYVDAIANNYSWSTYYHLTHIRKNILNWYPFNAGGDVLEIGCGMGAITSVLCDKCKSVTAVELSQKRAVGTLIRCREKDNLEIIVGNLNDIEFEKKFDYITLIGVLEYQGSYTDTDNPYLDFLKKIKGLLKPDGKLLVAIENQYGLKYWCGAREDHTAIPFEGMNQYSISNKKVRTFSKKALERLMKESGFENVYFYYPMPDYKMPMVVYSQDCLPKNSNMFNMEYYYVPDNKTLVAQEEKIYGDLIDNQVFDFFANSFLVECTEQGRVGEVTFASMSCKRFSEYNIGTRFTARGTVEKFALSNGERHLQEILENEEALIKRGIKVCKSRYNGQAIETEYVHEKTLEDVMLEAYRENNEEQIVKLWDLLYEEVLKSSPEIGWQDNLMYTFDMGITPDSEKYGPILETGYLDLIPRNAFYKEGEIIWFDQEWKLENIPAKFVLYRAMVEFYSSYKEANKGLSLGHLAVKMGVAALWKEFQELDSVFIGVVIDPVLLAESRGFVKDTRNAVINNLNKLINA